MQCTLVLNSLDPVHLNCKRSIDQELNYNPWMHLKRGRAQRVADKLSQPKRSNPVVQSHMERVYIIICIFMDIPSALMCSCMSAAACMITLIILLSYNIINFMKFVQL